MIILLITYFKSNYYHVIYTPFPIRVQTDTLEKKYNKLRLINDEIDDMLKKLEQNLKHGKNIKKYLNYSVSLFGRIRNDTCPRKNNVWKLQRYRWSSYNSISNLRWASRMQNKQNQGKHTNNTSGFKSVVYNKQHEKCQANIRIDGKLKHLCYFDTASLRLDF